MEAEPGQAGRVNTDLLELAKAYFLNNSSLAQINRLTGIGRPTLEYHAYKKPQGAWKPIRDRIEKLKAQAIASTLAKVANDYAETLSLSASRMLEHIRESGGFLSVQEQKALSDAINGAFRNQIEREKLNLAIAQANKQKYDPDEGILTDAEAEDVITSDPALLAEGNLKAESLEFTPGGSGDENDPKANGEYRGGGEGVPDGAAEEFPADPAAEAGIPPTEGGDPDGSGEPGASS